MEEKQKLNIARCLVHYAITPPLTAEGDEDENQIFQLVAKSITSGKAVYQGYRFVGDAYKFLFAQHTGEVDIEVGKERDKLTAIEGATNVFIDVRQSGATVFNSAKEFSGIAEELQNGNGELRLGFYYHDDVQIQGLKIQLDNVI